MTQGPPGPAGGPWEGLLHQSGRGAGQFPLAHRRLSPRPPEGRLMDRPRVTTHSLSSVDGQLTGFPVNLGLYYQTAAQLPQQAVLTTSATLLDAVARRH